MERTLEAGTGDAAQLFNASRPKSAASWGAIVAGALSAIAVTLILLSLGAGLGFAATSPWSDRGISATTFTVTAAIWLIVTQWVSALFGGYIAGRLRSRWIGTHSHEIFFRDTAHGFVAWSLATIFVAATVASSAGSLFGGGVKAASEAAAGAEPSMEQEAGDSALGYNIDKVFRSGGASDSAPPSSSDPRLEASRIVMQAMSTGSVPAADRTYLAQLVAARTGSSEADAQKRVDDLITTANEAKAKVVADADAARKAAAEVSIYTALSLLIGAFIASVAAALGGHLRDQHV